MTTIFRETLCLLLLSKYPKHSLKKRENFIKKETLAQVFSCEFCEISKNTFSYRAPPVAASVNFVVDIVYKFQTFLSLKSTVIIYKSFIRPHLDYRVVIYDQAVYESFHGRLETDQCTHFFIYKKPVHHKPSTRVVKN